MIDERPKVSIITPVLNRAQTIERCMDSVAGQSYERIEHIVVDGGSTDGTIEILKNSQIEHLSWTSQPDGGMYEAINRGMSSSTGDIVAYLNSDDAYFPWTVEVVVGVLSEEENHLVYGDMGVLVEGERRSFRIQFYRDFEPHHYTYIEAIGQPTVFWTRSLLRSIGPFDETFRYLGDWDYWLRAARSDVHLVHISEVLALQSDHPGTLRSRDKKGLQEEWRHLREKNAEWAGSDRLDKLRLLGTTLRTRRDRIRFHLEAQKRSPERWKRFLQATAEARLAPSLRDLFFFLLPGRVRPSAASIFEPSGIELLVLGEQRPDDNHEAS